MSKTFKSFPLRIKSPEGKIIILECNKSMSIAYVKELIETKLGISTKKQILTTYWGKHLENSRTLEDYNIWCPNYELHVLLRMNEKTIEIQDKYQARFYMSKTNDQNNYKFEFNNDLIHFEFNITPNHYLDINNKVIPCIRAGDVKYAFVKLLNDHFEARNIVNKHIAVLSYIHSVSQICLFKGNSSNRLDNYENLLPIEGNVVYVYFFVLFPFFPVKL